MKTINRTATQRSKAQPDYHKLQEIEDDSIEKNAEDYEREFLREPEDQIVPDDTFNDSFNNGYQLTRTDPELFEKLLADVGEDSRRGKGLLWGKWMYENDQETEKKTPEKESLDNIRAIREKSTEQTKQKAIDTNKMTLDEFVEYLNQPGREAPKDTNIEEQGRDYE